MENEKQTKDKNVTTKAKRSLEREYGSTMVETTRVPMRLRDATSGFRVAEKYGVYENAYCFLKHMNTHLKYNKKTFHQILWLLDDYMMNKVDIVEVSSRLKVLLEGHPHVTTGLNTFLPQGYKITIPLADLRNPPFKYKKVLEKFVRSIWNEKSTGDKDVTRKAKRDSRERSTEARSTRGPLRIRTASSHIGVAEAEDVYEDTYPFLIHMKATLKDEQKFNQIMKLLDDYMMRRVDVVEMFSRLKVLLHGHTDVVVIFNKFLPEGYKIDIPLANMKQPPFKYKKMLEVRFLNEQFHSL